MKNLNPRKQKQYIKHLQLLAQKKRQEKNSKNNSINIWRQLANHPILILLCVLITIFCGMATILPRFIVESSGQLDALDSYSQSFIVKNTGIIPLRDLSVSLGLCLVLTETEDFTAHQPFNDESKCEKPKIRITNPNWFHQNLNVDKSFQFALDDRTGITAPNGDELKPILSAKNLSPLVKADIIIIVKYRFWILPFYREKEFGFVAEKQISDKMMWKAKPFDD